MGKYVAVVVGVSSVIALFCGVVYGYVNNVISLVSNQGETIGMVAGRIIGIFLAPIGVLLGYM